MVVYVFPWSMEQGLVHLSLCMGFVFFHCVWWLVFPFCRGGGVTLDMAVCCFLLCMGFVFFLCVWRFVVFYCVLGLGLFHKQTADQYTAPGRRLGKPTVILHQKTTKAN